MDPKCLNNSLKNFCSKMACLLDADTTKNEDGAVSSRKLQRHQNRKGSPCKSWGMGESGFQKRDSVFSLSGNTNPFEEQMAESNIFTLCKNVKWEKVTTFDQW